MFELMIILTPDANLYPPNFVGVIFGCIWTLNRLYSTRE